MCRSLVPFLLIAACSSGGSAPPPGPDPDPDPDPVPVLFGLGDERVMFQGGSFPLDPTTPGPVSLERAFPNLSMGFLVFLTAPPDGTDRVFVAEKTGAIWVVPNDDTVSSKTVFLDLSGKIDTADERGLLGLAFDPDYATNGYFYVHYSDSGGSKAVVSRFHVSADPDKADSASEYVLLEIPDTDVHHNGGMLAFGPDGMLYTSIGDDDNLGNGQNRTTLPGSVLRIDPHGGTPYGIPSDNPFVGVGGGVRGEIWAYGFRNPWRFSFDRDTGDLWLGDVGGSTYEEIDVVNKGGNYGYVVYEGTHQLNNPPNPAPEYTWPVHQYGSGCVIGGYVYRGSQVPALSGAYVYGDNNTGEVWALRYDGSQVTSNARIGQVTRVTAFGEDRDGELHVLESGKIWRVEGGGVAGELVPNRLSATGLFTNTASLTPVPGLIEYEVNAELWSDGAVKRRWIGVPGSTRIEFSPAGDWDFPLGTVLVKHFELPVSATANRRLETRVLVLQNNGWAGYTYKWNFLGTDANLLEDADSQTYTVDDAAAPGGTRQQVWNFPSRGQCLLCHTPAAGFVLGLKTRQINRDFAYPGLTDNQLRAWNHVGLFDIDIGEARDYEAMPDPRDESAPLVARARAYLDSNCAQCHRAGSTTPGNLDLRYLTPIESANILDVPPSEGDLGLPDARRVKPGVKESSVLWERMRRLDGNRMPPLASGLVDEEAVTLVGEWIDGGP